MYTKEKQTNFDAKYCTNIFRLLLRNVYETTSIESSGQKCLACDTLLKKHFLRSDEAVKIHKLLLRFK